MVVTCNMPTRKESPRICGQTDSSMWLEPGKGRVKTVTSEVLLVKLRHYYVGVLLMCLYYSILCCIHFLFTLM